MWGQIIITGNTVTVVVDFAAVVVYEKCNWRYLPLPLREIRPKTKERKPLEVTGGSILYTRFTLLCQFNYPVFTSALLSQVAEGIASHLR